MVVGRSGFAGCVVLAWFCVQVGGGRELLSIEPDYVKAVQESIDVVTVTNLDNLPLKRVSAYKWANSASPQQVGQLHLFVLDDMRPVASSKIGPTVARFREKPDPNNTQIDHVIVSMTDQPLLCKFGDKVIWQASPTNTQFTRFLQTPEPHVTASLRLSQAKTLSREFSAQIDESEAVHASSSREMRLLAAPVYRYGSQDHNSPGTIDGFLFVFVVEGGNPTTFCHIEAIREKDVVSWQYAISRRGVSGQLVRYRGSKIWDAPRISDSVRSQSLFRIKDPRANL